MVRQDSAESLGRTIHNPFVPTSFCIRALSDSARGHCSWLQWRRCRKLSMQKNRLLENIAAAHTTRSIDDKCRLFDLYSRRRLSALSCSSSVLLSTLYSSDFSALQMRWRLGSLQHSLSTGTDIPQRVPVSLRNRREERRWWPFSSSSDRQPARGDHLQYVV